MRSIIFFFLVFLCYYSYGSNIMNLVLQKNENNLVVYLLSNSSGFVSVNKRFAVGPAGGLNELNFKFFDKTGTAYPFVAKIKPTIAEQSDIVLLGQKMLVGKSFDLERLTKLYGLNAGNYKVQAVYHNYHGVSNAYQEKIESAVLDITIEK